MQMKTHPDHSSLKEEREKKISAQLSALLNVAVKILKDPKERASYLLSLVGYPLLEEKVLMDDQLLMEIFQVKEVLASDSIPQNELKSIQELYESKSNETIETISSCFREGDYHCVKENLGKLQYFQNVLEDANSRIK